MLQMKFLTTYCTQPSKHDDPSGKSRTMALLEESRFDIAGCVPPPASRSSKSGLPPTLRIKKNEQSRIKRLMGNSRAPYGSFELAALLAATSGYYPVAARMEPSPSGEG